MPRSIILSHLLLGALCHSLYATADVAQLPVEAGMGPQPQLPAPRESLIPTVNIATAKGWPDGATPQAGAGLRVNAFAGDLDHPRWLYVLPNGDVLVAETNAPQKPADGSGVKSWFMKHFMKQAGSTGASANRITLLRDTNGDGVADQRSALLQGINSPFGMALVGGNLYIAATDAIVHFPYTEGTTQITAPATKLIDLPGGPRNHHWTKNIIASPDGSKLFATVGSNSNVAENGLDAEAGRAAIWEVDIGTGAHTVFATGLRNPNGLAWQPDTGVLWTVVNERDELGSDLVPDYLTSVRANGFYGWPYSYFGTHVDQRVKPQRPDLVANAIVPDYALGPHTASLGLAWFANDKSAVNKLPAQFASGMFIGQHGSWNRKPHSGYKVIFVPFENGKPAGKPIDVLTGFLSADAEAYGRPAGVAIDKSGALLVADDVGNIVWRVVKAP